MVRSIVIWAAFSCKEKTRIAVCPLRMNSQNYQALLKELNTCYLFGFT